jgi:hypothetical protein
VTCRIERTIETDSHTLGRPCFGEKSGQSGVNPPGLRLYFAASSLLLEAWRWRLLQRQQEGAESRFMGATAFNGSSCYRCTRNQEPPRSREFVRSRRMRRARARSISHQSKDAPRCTSRSRSSSQSRMSLSPGVVVAAQIQSCSCGLSAASTKTRICPRAAQLDSFDS